LSYTLRSDQGGSEQINYRLFPPKPFDHTQRYPLILWLHGKGDFGDDNLSQLKHIDSTIYRDGLDGTYPFFVLAPQCSAKAKRVWSTRVGNNGDDMLAVATHILSDVEHNYPVDESRITVVGISSGGTACWELAARYGDHFAAISPQGAGGSGETPIGRMLSIPIWAFHATNDPKTPPDGARATIISITSAGGIAILTETEDHEHNCWKTAFMDHDLLNWLLKQKRGQPSPLPGHYRPIVYLNNLWLQFRPRLTTFGIIVVVIVATYHHFRKLRADRANVLPEVFPAEVGS